RPRSSERRGPWMAVPIAPSRIAIRFVRILSSRSRTSVTFPPDRWLPLGAASSPRRDGTLEVRSQVAGPARPAAPDACLAYLGPCPELEGRAAVNRNARRTRRVRPVPKPILIFLTMRTALIMVGGVPMIRPLRLVPVLVLLLLPGLA